MNIKAELLICLVGVTQAVCYVAYIFNTKFTIARGGGETVARGASAPPCPPLYEALSLILHQFPRITNC